LLVWYHCSKCSCPTEDKIDDMNDSFYKELECVFDKFPKYHMIILLGDFSTKGCREDIFKPTIGNKILHEIGASKLCHIQKSDCQKYNVPTS
jgi:hypothetical protein